MMADDKPLISYGSLSLDIDLTRGCPDCGCAMFHPGPRGGVSINVMCVMCEACFNYSPVGAHRIDARPEFYSRSILREIEDLA